MALFSSPHVITSSHTDCVDIVAVRKECCPSLGSCVVLSEPWKRIYIQLGARGAGRCAAVDCLRESVRWDSNPTERKDTKMCNAREKAIMHFLKYDDRQQPGGMEQESKFNCPFNLNIASQHKKRKMCWCDLTVVPCAKTFTRPAAKSHLQSDREIYKWYKIEISPWKLWYFNAI